MIQDPQIPGVASPSFEGWEVKMCYFFFLVAVFFPAVFFAAVFFAAGFFFAAVFLVVVFFFAVAMTPSLKWFISLARQPAYFVLSITIIYNI